MWRYGSQRNLFRGVAVLVLCMIPCMVCAAPINLLPVTSKNLPLKVKAPQQRDSLVRNPLQLAFANALKSSDPQIAVASVPVAEKVVDLQHVKTIAKPDLSYVSFDFSKLEDQLADVPQGVGVTQEYPESVDMLPLSPLPLVVEAPSMPITEEIAALPPIKTIPEPVPPSISFDFSKLKGQLARVLQNIGVIQEEVVSADVASSAVMPSENVPKDMKQIPSLSSSAEGGVVSADEASQIILPELALSKTVAEELDADTDTQESQTIASIEEIAFPVDMPSYMDSPDKLDLSLGLSDLELMAGADEDSENYQDFFGAAGSSLPLSLIGRKGFVADVMYPVSLAAAVALALQNNFEVRAAMHGTDSAFWDKMGAYAQYLPTVEYTAARGTERSRPGSYNDEEGNRVLDTTHFRTDNAFSVRQPLFDPSIVADIMKFHSSEDLMESQETEVKEDIALKTVSAFLAVLHTRKTIQLIERYQGYLKKLQERMDMRLKGGAAIRADLDRISSRIMVVEAQRMEAAGQYRNALGEFSRLTRVMPSELQVPQNLIPFIPETEEDAFSGALQHNPAYQTSLSKVDAARGDRNRSFSGLLPKLSLEYSRSKTYNAGGVANGNPIDGVYPNQDDERLMLVASWKLTGGTSVTSGISGHSKIKQMMFLADDTRERMKTAIEIGYDALRSARDRIDVLQKAYLADKRIVGDFEEQYKHGSRSLFELLDAHERMHKSQLTLMSTIIAQAEAAYGIRQQMGELASSIVSSEKT